MDGEGMEGGEWREGEWRGRGNGTGGSAAICRATISASVFFA